MQQAARPRSIQHQFLGRLVSALGDVSPSSVISRLALMQARAVLRPEGTPVVAVADSQLAVLQRAVQVVTSASFASTKLEEPRLRSIYMLVWLLNGRLSSVLEGVLRL